MTRYEDQLAREVAALADVEADYVYVPPPREPSFDGAAERAQAREIKARYGYDPRGSATGPLEVLLCVVFPPALLVYGFIWWGRHRRRRFAERGF